MSSTALFGATRLADWIRSGGRPQRRISGHRALLWWHAYWFERNWQAQVERLGATAMPDDPVFILGMWRSGTTVLHELLAGCTQWVTPHTWQCFNPSTCFLTGAPSRESVVDRPMDQGQIATHGPQEDEFAALLLGEPSAYRGFLDPRRLSECGALLWPTASDTLPRWQTFIRGVASTASGTRLLLKSPGHTYRVSMLRALFPNAKFIWIGRHTGEVLASNVRMWGAMIDRYALWEVPAGAVDGFLQQALHACANVLDQCLDEMPRERMLWVDFEELRTDAKDVLQRVLYFLEPADEAAAMSRNLDSVLARVKVHAGMRAELPADPRVKQVEQRIAAARQRFGRVG